MSEPEDKESRDDLTLADRLLLETAEQQNLIAEQQNLIAERQTQLARQQTWIALSGFFTGLVALLVGCVAVYAALREAYAVTRQLEAQVWPDVLVGFSYHNESPGPGLPETPTYSLMAINSGIGPARMRAVEVSVDDIPQPDWLSTLQALGIEARYSSAFISQRTLRPDQELAFFTVADAAAAQALHEASQEGGRLMVEACYCSVFNNCWTAGLFAPKREVASCSAYDESAFTQ